MKNPAYLLALTLAVACTAALPACLQDKAPAPINPQDTLLLDTARFAYSLAIKPILDRNCALGGCHNPASRQAGVVLADYASARMAVEQKPVICAIEWQNNGCKPMPPVRPLPAADVQAIKNWQKTGFPQ